MDLSCEQAGLLVHSGIVDDDQHDPASGYGSINLVQKDDCTIKRRLWINVWLMNVAGFFMYMGIIPMVMIQSSFNSEAGLGVTSMAIKNGFMIVGSLVSPSVIHKFGCKSAMIIGDLMYVTFIPANYYPSWFTLAPLSALSGIGCSIESVARKVYLAHLANGYVEVTKTDRDRINSRIFALTYCTILLSNVGNLFASLILDSDVTDSVYNETNGEVIDARFSKCGPKYCNEDLNINSPNVNSTTIVDDRAKMTKIYVLISLCTASSLFSVAIACFLDPLSKLGLKLREDVLCRTPLSVLKSLLVALKNPLYIVFIPMLIALNGGDSFWAADFTKAFITCAIGLSYVGYVSAWNGLGSALACLLLGWFNSKATRCLPVVTSTLVQLLTLTGLFYWTPSSTSENNNYWTLSAYGWLFHFGSGIRQLFTPVLISVVFKDSLEISFMVYQLLGNVTSTVFYAWSNYLCIDFKIYFLMVFLALGFISYVGLEMLLNRRQRASKSQLRHFK